MRRFVLQQNVVRFQRALEAECDEQKHGPIRELLAGARRELALLEAELLGAEAAPIRALGEQAWRDHRGIASFRDSFDASPHPCMVLDPGPGLCIVDINSAHRSATHTGRDVIGRPLFDAFPDDPANAESESVHNLYAAFRAAAESGRQQTLPRYRYDVRRPDGHFVERYWRSETTPLIDAEGRLRFLLHKAEDVTLALAAHAAD
jgi:PAS domain-containing protein